MHSPWLKSSPVSINQPTPWSRGLLQKPALLCLVKNIAAFYGIQRFITVLTTARHLSLSRTNSPDPALACNSFKIPILLLSSHLRLGALSGLFPSGFLTNALYAFTLSDRYQTTQFQYMKKHLPYVTLAQISEDLVNKWHENKTTLLPATSRSWTKTATRGSSGGRGRSITDTVWNNTAPPGRHRQKPAHRMHNISLHFKMLLSHMCQRLANLCKWPSAPSPSWSGHTIDHKSATSRNSWTWRPISHFITTWQAPSQPQYIVSSNSARFQRVFQCEVGSFWKEMTAGVTTFTTRTFET
jgi:hypothetical protein